MKTVVFFGIFDPEYSRNRVLERGFRENGWNVVECSVDPRKYRGFSKFFGLARKWRQLRVKPDILFVAAPGQSVAWLARLLSLRGFIVFDAFTSLYDSNVFDRKKYPKWSWKGMRDFILDWYSLRCGDISLADTFENAKYLSRTFSVDEKRIVRVFLGSDIEPDFVNSPSGKHFVIHFHGTFIPLQGIEYIVRAAKILENMSDIRFRIIGGGQESAKIEALQRELKASNVQYYGKLKFAEVVRLIKEADIVLGIFGTTDKAARVIPNKVYEGAVFGKAMISRQGPAMAELFEDSRDICLVRPGDETDLAQKIMNLRQDNELRRKIGENVRKLFLEKLLPKDIVSELLSAIGSGFKK